MVSGVKASFGAAFAFSCIDSMAENIQKLQKEKEAERELTEDDLVFQFAPLGENTKKFYLVDNVGRVDFLRLLHDFAGQNREIMEDA